jgi:hypothetical protein
MVTLLSVDKHDRLLLVADDMSLGGSKQKLSLEVDPEVEVFNVLLDTELSFT